MNGSTAATWWGRHGGVTAAVIFPAKDERASGLHRGFSNFFRHRRHRAWLKSGQARDLHRVGGDSDPDNSRFQFQTRVRIDSPIEVRSTTGTADPADGTSPPGAGTDRISPNPSRKAVIPRGGWPPFQLHEEWGEDQRERRQ